MDNINGIKVINFCCVSIILKYYEFYFCNNCVMDIVCGI